MSTNQQFGQYELQQRIGGDTTGEIWKAYDVQQRRHVAIKVIRMDPQVASGFLPRFLQEVPKLTALQHPNIARILDIQTAQAGGDIPNEIYIVMEYIDGPLLADYIHMTAHAGQFPSAIDLTRLLTAIASALDYAHQRGVLHGDLKPTTIILDKSNTSVHPMGEPKLIGFGQHSLPRPLTAPAEEAAYVSPETAQNIPLGGRSDIYSLGVILYELCTGVQPFEGETAGDIMMQHIRSIPSAPALINPRILPALTAVIMRSLAKDPAARFPSAASLAVAVAKAFNILPRDTGSQSGISGSLSGSLQGVSLSQYLANQLDAEQSPTMLAPWSQRLNPTPANRVESLGSGPSSIPLSSFSPAATPPQQIMTPGQPSGSGIYSGQSVPSGNLTGYMSMPPSMALMPIPQPQAPEPQPKRSRRGLYILLAVVGIVLLLGSSAAYYLLNIGLGPFAVRTPSVGQAFFASSGLINLSSTTGIADRVQINLSNLPSPQAGNKYYVWLLGDDALKASPILLGDSVGGTRVNITYPGNTERSNLLANYSRLLITEESGDAPPINPSVSPADYRYYAEFSRVLNTQTEPPYSLLDHIRHLLAQDPTLEKAGLVGGLDTWLFKNTTKILEWSGSARDARTSGNIELARRQLVRILDYLDGAQYVKTEGIPPDLPTLLVDEKIAQIALLEVTNQQTPKPYLKHISDHLLEINQFAGVTPEQKALSVEINKAIVNVKGWLQAVRADASKLVKMTPQQLAQPETLVTFNHMFNQANFALVGQTDPNTNQVKPGVVQIHYDIQRLATFVIMPCDAACVEKLA